MCMKSHTEIGMYLAGQSGCTYWLRLSHTLYEQRLYMSNVHVIGGQFYPYGPVV